jgi:NhaA family Na+:H+ antiporter
MIREFIRLEASSGVILLIAAVLALVFDNTPHLHTIYQDLFGMPVTLQVGALILSKPLLLWINEGFMAVFFLLVGLEIKREIIEGELSTLKKCALPGFAALGGIIVPALVYVAFNHQDPVALKGWAIPTATDIAFSLGLLALVGSRAPVSLKIFLTALAIFDDIGAVVIIAVFYTRDISMWMLSGAGLFTVALVILNRLKVMKSAPYIVVGLALWFCVLKSGVHATLAGIIVALAIPLHNNKDPEHSPLRRLEHSIHPWVAFGVLPIFAFANAGVSFAGISWSLLLSPMTLGIACGLFIGKQIGIWGASWLGVKLKLAHLPHGANFWSIYGVSLMAGVGFTMSLFIGSLAFGNMATSHADMVRVGVLIGSFFSGVIGYLALRFGHRGGKPIPWRRT